MRCLLLHGYDLAASAVVDGGEEGVGGAHGIGVAEVLKLEDGGLGVEKSMSVASI